MSNNSILIDRPDVRRRDCTCGEMVYELSNSPNVTELAGDTNLNVIDPVNHDMQKSTSKKDQL